MVEALRSSERASEREREGEWILFGNYMVNALRERERAQTGQVSLGVRERERERILFGNYMVEALRERERERESGSFSAITWLKPSQRERERTQTGQVSLGVKERERE